MKKHLFYKILILVLTLVASTLNAQTGCWKQVTSGQNFSLGIKNDGTLWAWGLNASSQLGDGGTSNKYTPGKIGTDNDWSQVSAGSVHVLALKNDGTLWAWGIN